MIMYRRRSRPVVVLLLLALCLFAVPVQARAQTLTIQGDRFAVDGTPKFLVFISYFGAMGAPHILQDLHFLRSLGFDGVRIWPNLDTGPQILNGDGSLRPAEFDRFLSILDQAKLEHLIVDVTFTYEHVPGMTPETARIGIANVADALRSYTNVLFDIQNERNVGDRRYMAPNHVKAIYDAVKAVDPSRITTASNSPIYTVTEATNFTTALGLDVTAYHEPRFSGWFTLGTYQGVVNRMRSNGKPAYLQEPNNTRDTTYRDNFRADSFLQAIVNAKRAGAAAWCFHTLEGADFRSGPEYLEDRLRAFPEPEWTFVTSVGPKVLLRANDAAHFVVPENGGGAGVRADRAASGPGSWEILSLIDLTGGPPISGDRVAFLTANGSHYFQAANGGGGALRASSQNPGAWETFVIETASGGPIGHGSSVTLRAGNTGWYVTAEGGGGGNINVTALSPGAWETFTIFFATPHSTAFANAGSLREISIRPPK
jgi:hypothetical protein